VEWSSAVPFPNVARCGAMRSPSSTRRRAPGNLDLFLRRIEVWDQEQQRFLVFLTNHRGFAASTIAGIYRQRWQIELFSKALKQNLRIKTFVGTSPNALHIQIWTALRSRR
jgi:IS4 transposase